MTYEQTTGVADVIAEMQAADFYLGQAPTDELAGALIEVDPWGALLDVQLAADHLAATVARLPGVFELAKNVSAFGKEANYKYHAATRRSSNPVTNEICERTVEVELGSDTVLQGLEDMKQRYAKGLAHLALAVQAFQEGVGGYETSVTAAETVAAVKSAILERSAEYVRYARGEAQ